MGRPLYSTQTEIRALTGKSAEVVKTELTGDIENGQTLNIYFEGEMKKIAKVKRLQMLINNSVGSLNGRLFVIIFTSGMEVATIEAKLNTRLLYASGTLENRPESKSEPITEIELSEALRTMQYDENSSVYFRIYNQTGETISLDGSYIQIEIEKETVR